MRSLGPTRSANRLRLESLEARLMMDAGALDPAFGVNGIVDLPIPSDMDSSDLPAAISTQSDGKLIVIGTSQLTTHHPLKYGGRPVVTRLLPNGDLDDSFGSHGIQPLLNGDEYEVSSVLVQADDSLLVAGTLYQQGGDRGFITRLGKDGALDATFGDSGRIILPGRAIGAVQLSRQSDGKVIAAAAADKTVTVARLLSNGQFDSAFAGLGLTTIEFGEGNGSEATLAIQADDRILLGRIGGANDSVNVEVTRLDRYGQLDAGFAAGQSWTTEIGGDVPGPFPTPTLTPAPGGSIYVGYPKYANNSVQVGVAKLLANGTLDRSFGVGGEVTATASHSDDRYSAPAGVTVLGNSQIAVFTAVGKPSLQHTAALLVIAGDGSAVHESAASASYSHFTNQVAGIARQRDGKLVGLYAFGERNASADFGIVRWDSTGALDVGYGAAGTSNVDIVPTASRVEAATVLALSSGKLAAVGQLNEGARIPFVARFLPTGELDPSFAVGGHAVLEEFHFNYVNPIARGIGVGPNGQFVVISTFENCVQAHLYGSDGRLNGVRILEPNSNIDKAKISYREDGSIVVVGEYDSSQGQLLKVMQLGPDGSLEASVLLPKDGPSYAVDAQIVGDQTLILGYHFATGEYEVMRVDRDGSLDSDFGSNGGFIVPGGGPVLPSSLHADAEGQITIGYSSFPTSSGVILRRYDERGDLVSSFGDRGVAELNSTPGNSSVKSMVSDIDGSLLVGVEKSNGSFYQSQLLRVLPDGTLDHSFGTAGVITYPQTGFDEALTDLVFSGNDLIMAGNVDHLLGANLQLRRIQLDRPLNLWRNGVEPLNVNGDAAQAITPLDALIVINELNSAGARSLGFTGDVAVRPSSFIDVNGDGYLSAIDALIVINWLNSNPAPSALKGAAGPTSAAQGGNQTAADSEGESIASTPDDDVRPIVDRSYLTYLLETGIPSRKRGR